MRFSQAGRFGGLLCLMLLSTMQARAQLAERVDVRWTTTSECTRPLDLEWQVTRLLGSERGTDALIALDARVTLLTSQRYALALDISRGSVRARRELELGSCVEVQEAVAVLAAIALDPGAATRVAPPPPRDLAPPRVQLPRAPPPRKPRRTYPWHPALRLGALGDLQSLPAVSGGPSLGVELVLPALHVWTGGHYLAPRTAETPTSNAGARVDLFAGVLGVAYLARFSAIALGPCFLAELGYMRASGIGVAERQLTGTLWGSALFGARVDYVLTKRLGLHLEIVAGAPVRRPRFAFRPSTVFYETRAITARIELGVLVRLDR